MVENLLLVFISLQVKLDTITSFSFFHVGDDATATDAER